jgi:hypothetical protein
MIPRSISATSLNVAKECLARYKAENIDRAPRGHGGSAALLGTSVHGALEAYVKTVYLDKAQQPDLDLLRMLYMKSYMDIFETRDLDSDLFRDGEEMLERWFGRVDEYLKGAEIISCEVKETFDVTVPDDAGNTVTVPFNYIWDRVDSLEGGRVIRVVDYKTQRWAWSPAQLRNKPQARLYGLAAQIKWPAAEEIWVEFDFLRHDPSVAGVRFTKDDNKETWLDLKKLLKKIVDTPDSIEFSEIEQINDDCRWCVRKAGCSALQKSAFVGSARGMELPQLIDRRAEANLQIKALKLLLEEADSLIEAAARQADTTELTTDNTVVSFSRRSRREVDADRAEIILGPELFAELGSRSLPLAAVDDLLKKKDTRLTDEQKAQLRSIIATTMGEPYVVTKPKE